MYESVSMYKRSLEIDLSDFRHWCESQADTVIGYVGSDLLSPVAFYLRAKTGLGSVFVMPEKVIINSEDFQPPQWVSYLCENIQEQSTLILTGKVVLKMLEEIAPRS